MTASNNHRVIESWPTLLPGRWDGVTRPYDTKAVARLRPSTRVAHTLAEIGARRLWGLLHSEELQESTEAAQF